MVRRTRRSIAQILAVVLLGLISMVSAAMAGGIPVPRASGSSSLSGPLEAFTIRPVNSSTPLLEVLTTFSVGDNPVAPAYDSANGYVYVVNYLSNNVTVVDGLSPIATVPVGTNPTSALYDPGNGYVYVTDSNESRVSVINNTSVIANVTTGDWPGTAAYDPVNGFVYVPNGRSANVTVINGTSVEGAIPLVGSESPRSASYDPGDGLVYVADWSNGTLYAINNTTALSPPVNVGGESYSGTYDPANGLLYVAGLGSGNISILQGTKVVAKVAIGGFAYPPTYDSGNGLVYVSYLPWHTANYTAAVMILNGTSSVANLTWGSNFSLSSVYGPYGNGTGYVYEITSGTLTAIGGKSLAGSVNLTGLPDGGVYDPANGYVYVTILSSASHGNLSIVTCPSCYGVTLTENGAPVGSMWSLTASNSTTWYAETVSAKAPASITMRLMTGVYSLHLSAPEGVSIRVISPGATYSASDGTLWVNVVSPPPGGGGPGAGPLPTWTVLLMVAVVAGASVGAAVVINARRLRRQGEELVAGMRKAIDEGVEDLGRPR